MKKFITTELIGKSSRLITNNLAQKLLEVQAGVTTEQWIILQILLRGAMTQKELSEKTLKNKASINSLVSNLLKLELVDKKISEKDKRETRVSLNNKGEEVRARVAKIAAISVDQALNGFSNEEIENLNSLLNRVKENLIK